MGYILASLKLGETALRNFLCSSNSEATILGPKTVKGLYSPTGFGKRLRAEVIS